MPASPPNASTSDPSSPPVPPLPPGVNARPEAQRRRWLPWVAGGVLLVLIGLGLRPRPIPVEVTTVGSAPLRVTIDEEGITQVRQRYVVAAPVAGHLRRITLKPGARVVAGETVLASLEAAGADLLDARGQAQAEARVGAATNALGQATAQAERAAAALKLAETEAARRESLAERGLISQQELDVARTEFFSAQQEARASEFGQRVAEFEVAQARAALVRAQPGAGGDAAVWAVTSPVSGVVLRVLQESARNVVAGHALLEVGDPADLEVRIEVLSRDGVGITPGARVWLEQWGGEPALEARVRLVEPAAFTKVSALGVEEQRVNVIADLVTPAVERVTLGDAFRVEARIVRWEGDDVRQVPAGALFQRAGAWQVFVVEGGRASLRRVTPGRSDGVNTQVLDGLAEGETVIIYPGDRIAEGVSVSGITGTS
jgi:HlyD family secretion protein